MKSEEFLAICLLISFILNQLAIEGKTSLRYREDDGTGRKSGLNRTAKMRGLVAHTDSPIKILPGRIKLLIIRRKRKQTVKTANNSNPTANIRKKNDKRTQI